MLYEYLFEVGCLIPTINKCKLTLISNSDLHRKDNDEFSIAKKA